MEKDSRQGETRLSERKIFPNLKRTYSASKNFITLSKVSIDKSAGIMDGPNSHLALRQTATSFSHKRIISGGNVRQFIQCQMSKTYRNSQQVDMAKADNLGKHKSNSNMITQSKETLEKVPPIDKAKISTKSIGLLKGYSVNSHPGSMSTLNEDRICVITNLNKAAHRDHQISFFSIYDGKNGAAKSEYFRDNFHSVMTQDRDFSRDIENAIKRTAQIVQEDFKRSVEEAESSSTDFIMAVLIDRDLYIASMGGSKVVVSLSCGQGLVNPLSPQEPGSRSVSKSKPPRKQSGRPMTRMVKLDAGGIDFVALGSEGLFQNLDELAIGRAIWREILSRTPMNLHAALGETANFIMGQVFQQASTKNVSLILMAFEGVQKCFQGQQVALELPFVQALPNECEEDY